MNGNISFFFMANSILLCIYTISPFIHSSVNRHLDCFHVLAIVNCAAMSISVTVPFLNCCLTLEKGHFLMLLLIMSALSLSFLPTLLI